MNAGTVASWEHSWPWPTWCVVLLVAVVTVCVLAIYWNEGAGRRSQRIGLASIRIALLVLTVWMMYGFTLRSHRTERADLLVVVDDSASMSVVDQFEKGQPHDSILQRLQGVGLGPATRLNQAKAVLMGSGQRMERLSDRYQLKVMAMNSAQPVLATDIKSLRQLMDRVEASHNQSELGNRLRVILDAQRGRSTAAIVLFTDGITTKGQSLAAVAHHAKRRGIPLYLVGLGSEQPARDVELSNLLVDEVVFVNDLITFDLAITANGFQNQTLVLELRKKGQPEILDQRAVHLRKTASSVRARLAYQATEKGEFEFTIATPTQEMEAKLDNNVLTCRVSVRDESIKVLLVQAYPSYEFRYLKSLLGRGETDSGEGSFSLDVVLQDAEPEFAEIDGSVLRTFPSSIEELAAYDVCVFGDVDPDRLSQDSMRNLRDFVIDRGRGLVFVAGPQFLPVQYAGTPLSELIPFEISTTNATPADVPIIEGFCPTLTLLGQQTPHMQLATDQAESQQRWNALPPLFWLLNTGTLKPGARVLLQHPTQSGQDGDLLPVVMVSYVGAGKVQFHAIDDTWRWRFRVGDELFGRFWTQTIRYLSRFRLGEDRNAELVSDREIYEVGDVAWVRARFFDDRLAPTLDDGVVMVLEGDGTAQRITLRREATDRGTFSTSLNDLAPGAYRGWLATPLLSDAAPSCDFSVTTPDTEMERLAMDAADLRTAAARSGGGYYTMADVDSLPDDLPAGRQVRIESLPPVTIWNDWKVAFLFVALLIAEWVLRKRVGLL